MMRIVQILASLRLTLASMILLAVLALVGSRSSALDVGVTALPIALLALNLLAAIASNRAFRTQTGLLVFHVGLLIVFVLIGASVLIRFDGHFEIVEGGDFDADSVEISAAGWLHPNRLDQIRLQQSRIEVDYGPGLTRGQTRSTLLGDGRTPMTIGDRRGALVHGYRLLTTFNKGFAVVLSWQPAEAEPVYGAVHFPSFPGQDWKQLAEWMTPDGRRLELELVLAESPVSADQPWTLRSNGLDYSLLVRGDVPAPATLQAGDAIAVGGGVLGVADLRVWMAYRIDYNPLLPWIFAAALLSIAGLAMHVWRQFFAIPAERRTGARDDALVAVS